MGETALITTFKTADEETLSAVAEEKRVRQSEHVVLLFSMGSQFDHLIALSLAKLGIYCLVANPGSVHADDVRALKPSGIIISGGPASEFDDPPPFDRSIFDIGIPTLGICLGAQMAAKHLGATVRPGEKREFSVEKLRVLKSTAFIGADLDGTNVQQSHGDIIEIGNSGIEVIASTSNSPVAAFEKDHLFGVQFHPEVTESARGIEMLDNFCGKICGIDDRFPAEDVAARKITKLKAEIGDGDVVIGLSGGSDSSVVANLLRDAMRDSKGTIHGIYIKGIDRPDDEAHVHDYFGNHPWIRVEVVDATDEFLSALAGKLTMKEKRIAMRGVYKQKFETKVEELRAKGVEKIFVAQGTLYTDLVESGVGHETEAKRAQIKLHHNTKLDFSVPELSPLDDCVKDTARDIGRSIGVPEALLIRHPFPGPGQIVRIEGEVTREKLAIVHAADDIYISEMRKWGLYESVWQAGPVVTNSRCTCTKGDAAAEGWVIALWAVWSVNGFTARPARLPWDFLEHVADRITNEIREVGSVTYRISGKPPATIEWG